MTMLATPTRRFFIGAALSLLAAPAVVRASSLMPVKVVRGLSDDEMVALLSARIDAAHEAMKVWMNHKLYGDVGFSTTSLPQLPKDQVWDYTGLARELVLIRG